MFRPMGLPRRLFPELAAIYLGGVIGALARVGLAEAVPHSVDSWPWPTFLVNVVGALLLGFFYVTIQDRRTEGIRHPFLATGICGTLTTFSAMQLELLQMLEAGETALAFAYLAASLVLGYAALRCGMQAAVFRGLRS